MYFSHDNKTKLLELLKKDGGILPNEREKILEKVEKMTERQIGELLREVVDGHFELGDIEEEIDNQIEHEALPEEEKRVDDGDYSQKGQIGVMRKIEEQERKSAEEKLEISPEDLN